MLSSFSPSSSPVEYCCRNCRGLQQQWPPGRRRLAKCAHNALALNYSCIAIQCAQNAHNALALYYNTNTMPLHCIQNTNTMPLPDIALALQYNVHKMHTMPLHFNAFAFQCPCLSLCTVYNALNAREQFALAFVLLIILHLHICLSFIFTTDRFYTMYSKDRAMYPVVIKQCLPFFWPLWEKLSSRATWDIGHWVRTGQLDILSEGRNVIEKLLSSKLLTPWPTWLLSTRLKRHQPRLWSLTQL